jgi:hypothetical protein
MQSMCQVYAAVSYICKGDAESSSEVSILCTCLFFYLKLSNKTKHCFTSFHCLGTRIDWSCLQNHGLICWCAGEDLYYFCLWAFTYETAESTRSTVRAIIVTSEMSIMNAMCIVHCL